MAEQEIKTTYVRVTAEADLAMFVGDLSGEQLKEMLSGAYPFLATSVYSVRPGDEPGTQIVVFSEKFGSKG